MQLIFMMVVGMLIPSASQAGPSLDLPEVSGPSIPYVHFGGTIDPFEEIVLSTIPDDKELIITLVVTESNVALHTADAVLVPSSMAEGSKGAMANGTAHVPVGSGKTLTIRNEAGGARGYFVQGYWAESGSPYRSFYAESFGGEGTIMTADSVRPFLVQTILASQYCDVMIDDAIAIPSRSLAAYIRGGLLNGKGTIVVPAGARLHVTGSFGYPCNFYFMNGKYLTP